MKSFGDSLHSNILLIEGSISVPFIKFYKTIGSGDFKTAHIPDETVLWECLTILEKYYREYLAWYARVRPKLRVREDVVIEQYRAHLSKIKQALASNDVEMKVRTIDKAIQQWHIDFPVIEHLRMEEEQQMDADYEDEVYAKEWTELLDILKQLGKLPGRHSPYK